MEEQDTAHFYQSQLRFGVGPLHSKRDSENLPDSKLVPCAILNQNLWGYWNVLVFLIVSSRIYLTLGIQSCRISRHCQISSLIHILYLSPLSLSPFLPVIPLLSLHITAVTQSATDLFNDIVILPMLGQWTRCSWDKHDWKKCSAYLLDYLDNVKCV